jgi:sirohydrochlorin ferrochelatase
VTDVILLAHGSPDARAQVALEGLACAVEDGSAAFRVHTAVLDHGRGLVETCETLASLGATEAIVVPVFLSTAFHVRIDVPRVVADARTRTSLRLTVTDALGSSPALLAALDRLLPDGPVALAVAGTSDARAQGALDELAQRWARSRGAAVVVAHASQAQPDLPAALAALESPTGQAAAVAALVLFPGVLPERIAAQAAGRFVTPPLYQLPETAALVLERVRATTRRAA